MREWLHNPTYRRAAVGFAAGASLMLASLANFLSHNGYPYWRADVGIVALGLTIVCALAGIFYSAQRQWGRSVLEGLLAAFFLDLNTDSHWLVAIAGVGVAAFTALRRTSLLEPMMVVGSVIFLTTAAGIGVRSSWMTVSSGHNDGPRAPTNSRPAIVHLILDEHIGIEGLPNDAEAQGVRNRLKKFYLGAGFAVYGGAYSEHLRTVNAIPNILNYGDRLAQKASLKGAVVGPTKYLLGLQRENFRIFVLQSEFADYCTGTSFHRCITYDSSALAPILEAKFDLRDRSSLILFKFLSLATSARIAFLSWFNLARKLKQHGFIIPARHLELLERSSTIGALVALDKLTVMMRETQLGDVYFAHLLLPHYPYVVDKHCTYLPQSAWEYRRSRSSERLRLHRYYGQIECITSKIDTMLKVLKNSRARENVIFIIHGDHGSRITRIDPNEPNLGKFTTPDVVAGFSTLFAVKGPQVAPGYTPVPQPVSTLLRDFAESGFTVAPPTNRPLRDLQLDDWEWRPRQHMPLPKEWTDRLTRPNVVQE